MIQCIHIYCTCESVRIPRECISTSRAKEGVLQVAYMYCSLRGELTTYSATPQKRETHAVSARGSAGSVLINQEREERTSECVCNSVSTPRGEEEYGSGQERGHVKRCRGGGEKN